MNTMGESRIESRLSALLSEFDPGEQQAGSARMDFALGAHADGRDR
ncbi:hypothetical protein [Rhodococcus erythropolis]|nr:hypothetical protein [Rhodococcus erythropolis]MBT2269617.1 hypothetical protein [Rhodococcus erythropolis]